MLPITTQQQFPTLLPDASPADRPAASAALGIIAFERSQGSGWYKGGHDDVTANMLVCLERGKRCVLILANDVRAGRAFSMQVRAALGDTGVQYGGSIRACRALNPEPGRLRASFGIF